MTFAVMEPRRMELVKRAAVLASWIWMSCFLVSDWPSPSRSRICPPMRFLLPPVTASSPTYSLAVYLLVGGVLAMIMKASVSSASPVRTATPSP